MRICVYGAGAIGGHLAVRLARGGAEVSVLARGAHLAAIQQSGLTVHTTEGQLNARVQASDDPVAAGIVPLLKPDTAVAFIMNGIPWFYFHGIGGALEGRRLPKIDPDDALWRTVGPERAIAGVVYAASTVIAPGVIELENASPRVVLGEPDNRETQRIQAIAAHINGGGMQAIVSTKIRDEIWNKLLGNLGNGPLTVLTQVSMQELFKDQLCVDAALRVMAESQAVANALGAHPSGNHEKRIEHSKGIDHKPSILQDLELGRPMEIDGIFDAPLELARMVGVPTPTLDLLVAMAKVRARAAGLYQG